MVEGKLIGQEDDALDEFHTHLLWKAGERKKLKTSFRRRIRRGEKAIIADAVDEMMEAD